MYRKSNPPPFTLQRERASGKVLGFIRSQALAGTRRYKRSNHLMHRCPKSIGSQYISGQPPTMHLIPFVLHSWTASFETLP